MASVNKVILIGHLGKDPDVRQTASGTAVGNLSVATTEKFKDRDGNTQEKTEWHRVVVWGKTAEHCRQYLSKGRLIYVEGSLETRKYTDKDGVDHQSTEVKAHQITFLGGDPKGSGGGGQSRGPAPSGPAAPKDEDFPF